MVEEQVYQFIKQGNRPYNVQLVADNLAKYGLKKPAIQKALEALADGGKITCKEFGKTKIYVALQSDFPAPEPQELEQKNVKLRELNEQTKSQDENLRYLKRELRAMQESLTLNQLHERISALKQQVQEAETRLVSLRDGAVLVTAEDKAAAEQAFTTAMSHWAKRKRIFKNVWNAVSENIDGNLNDLLEEMGVESDESLQLDFAAMSALLPKRGRF